jgi:MFS family permease
VLQFYLYSLEFASVEMISVAMEARPDILEMFGGAWNAMITTNFESFLYSVPRAVWPGKPTVFYDLSHGITAALGATPFEDPTVGYASTLIGTSFLMGGIIGTLVAMLLLGILTARFDRRLQRRDWSDGSIVLYALALVVVFHLFRQGTLGWTFIVSVVQNYGVLLALLVLCVVAKERRSSPSPRANTSVRK